MSAYFLVPDGRAGEGSGPVHGAGHRRPGDGLCWWQSEGKLVNKIETNQNSGRTAYTRPLLFFVFLCPPLACSVVS